VLSFEGYLSSQKPMSKIGYLAPWVLVVRQTLQNQLASHSSGEAQWNTWKPQHTNPPLQTPRPSENTSIFLEERGKSIDNVRKWWDFRSKTSHPSAMLTWSNLRTSSNWSDQTKWSCTSIKKEFWWTVSACFSHLEPMSAAEPLFSWPQTCVRTTDRVLEAPHKRPKKSQPRQCFWSWWERPPDFRSSTIPWKGKCCKISLEPSWDLSLRAAPELLN
jgi:hypothetical protein